MTLTVPYDLAVLEGATIERVDIPSTDLVTFALRDVRREAGPRRETLVLAAGSTLRGVGLVDRRPRGQPATAFCMLLRKHLVGARIERIRSSTRSIELSLSLDATRRTLELDVRARPGDVILRADDDTILGSLRPRRGDPQPPPRTEPHQPTHDDPQPSPRSDPHQPTRDDPQPSPRTDPQQPTHDDPQPSPRDDSPRGGEPTDATLAQEGVRLLADAASDDLAERQRELVRALGRTLTKLRRRSTAIAADLERLAGADELRRIATLLAPLVSRVPSGARSVRATDWSVDPPREIEVPLDPSRPARAQVDAMFRRARGFDRGRHIAETRAASTADEIARAELLLERAVAATERAPLEAVAAEAAHVGVLPKSLATPPPVAGRRRASAAPKPYRAFRGAGGRAVLVGKTAAANDELTLRVARPHDLWLHVRDHAGSHVVVPMNKGASCPSELLVDAAHLAAHFSAARGQDRVEVSYLERRHVRKPKGAAPGAVNLDRERVMLLAFDPARLATLLASEQPD